MNFDFSDELKQLREEARRFLTGRNALAAARRVLDGEGGHDAALWREIGEMGWIGAAIPEEFGGAGLGPLGLCVLAEELGASLAPVPFSSSVYLAAEAILLAGSDAQKQRYLPKIASGASHRHAGAGRRAGRAGAVEARVPLSPATASPAPSCR